MRQPARPTLIGDLDTPVPLVEVSRLETNLRRMSDRLAPMRVSHRPHAKAHKTRQVAERQIEHGTVGLTVAKVGEAEAMVEVGFDDILIAYPLVAEAKIKRLLPLLERARIRFTVDSIAGATAASSALDAAGRTVEVLIEVESGNGRTGVQTDDELLRLADVVEGLPGLALAGVLTFGAGYVDGTAAHRAVGRYEGSVGVDAADLLRKAGHTTMDIVSCGCTPTTPYAAEVEGVTEVRAGNYAFYDCKQVSMGAATYDECALTVLATVVSHPLERRYVLDAGMKSLAGEDYGWGTYGRLLGRTDIVISWAAEEHGVIELADDVTDPKLSIGDRVRIIPNHACGLSNMHDALVAVDGEQVLETWPVIGRGLSR